MFYNEKLLTELYDVDEMECNSVGNWEGILNILNDLHGSIMCQFQSKIFIVKPVSDASLTNKKLLLNWRIIIPANIIVMNFHYIKK